jgi:hypothetical protein
MGEVSPYIRSHERGNAAHLTKLRSLSLIFALVHSHVVGIENSTSIVSALNF